MTVSSAHRTPERTVRLIRNAEKRGFQVIIGGAGAAAHLAGVIAAHTVLPVIGVPIDSSPLKGLDALYSTVQMPPGVPVAAMAIGKAGAKNAALFAIQILGIKDPIITSALKDHRKKMASEVLKKAKKVERS
jgi:phosphoribosylaminoimidazole carboxylase PurE protein